MKSKKLDLEVKELTKKMLGDEATSFTNGCGNTPEVPPSCDAETSDEGNNCG